MMSKMSTFQMFSNFGRGGGHQTVFSQIQNSRENYGLSQTLRDLALCWDCQRNSLQANQNRQTGKVTFWEAGGIRLQKV